MFFRTLLLLLNGGPRSIVSGEEESDEAIAAAHHACSGVPRLLNQLLTQAIDCAEEADQSLIDERVIDVAWAQLQQLPSPMVDEPKIQIESTAVEFGEHSAVKF